MRCSDYRNLIDEMIDGELETSVAEDVARHLSGCGSCAGEARLIREEKALYAQFHFEIEPPAELSQRFRAILASEQVSEIASSGSLWERVRAGFFGSFGWTATAVCVLIAAVIVLFGSRAGSDQAHVATVRSSSTADIISFPVTDARPTAKAQTAVQDSDLNDLRKDRPKSLPDRVARTASSKRETRANDAWFRDELAEIQNFENDVTRQAEKVELLLRSFRNSRISDDTETYEVSFEKVQARALLVTNAKLRARAQDFGAIYVLETLERVEPYLLDIANLEPIPSPVEVLEIKRRLREQSVIASLQGF